MNFSGNLFAFRYVRVLYLQSNSDILQLAGSGLGFVPLLLSFSSAPLMLWFNSEVSEGLKLYYTDERDVRCLTYEGLPPPSCCIFAVQLRCITLHKVRLCS